MDKEYFELRAYLEEKTHCLWKHETKVQREKEQEEKNYYQGGFSPYNCGQYDTPDGVHFGFAFTQSFLDTVKLYEEAFYTHSASFGTGDATDVMTALYNTMCETGNNLFDWDIARYRDYIMTESCLYAVPKTSGKFSDDFLRIDLFRLFQTKNDKMEFTGGLLHMLDHFSIDGKNLATDKDVNDVHSIWDVIHLCFDAFSKKEMISESKAVSYLPVDEAHHLKISFYREAESGAFYINTAHLERI